MVFLVYIFKVNDIECILYFFVSVYVYYKLIDVKVVYLNVYIGICDYLFELLIFLLIWGK